MFDQRTNPWKPLTKRMNLRDDLYSLSVLVHSYSKHESSMKSPQRDSRMKK